MHHQTHTYRGAPNQGWSAAGTHDRQSHHEKTRVAKEHDKEAGELRHAANSVSGAYLVKHDPGESAANDHFWSVNVRGDQARGR